jgi:hypothetical protein
MKMSRCSECAFLDVRRHGAECPLCEEGVMRKRPEKTA